MDVYISKFHSHKQAVTAFFLLILLFALPVNGQRLTTTDTLLYRHHYPGQDAYPELTTEDSYMELHVQGGIVRKGFFWGTTDMMDHAREGYACGFFVLPMTDITHAMDSVSFTLKTVKDDDGNLVNIFTFCVKYRFGRMLLHCILLCATRHIMRGADIKKSHHATQFYLPSLVSVGVTPYASR